MKNRIFLIMLLLVVFYKPIQAQRRLFDWVKCYQGYQEREAEQQRILDSLIAAGVDISVYFPSDPNEIRGTVGYDNPNSGDTLQWVSATQSLPYTIYFENDPDMATAAAQRVEIRHPFHSLGNLATFGIGSFGFGEHIFEVEGSPSSYQQRLDLREAFGLYVDVVAGVDVVTNEAFWIFQSIDPTTGLPPQGAEQGFLPINDENHSGEGFVTFSIKPMSPACSTGDVITASAYIVFDINEAISTNTWLNTIDAVPPTTQLTGNEMGANELVLQFSGSDDMGGCGIKQYKLYVSDNYAAYQLYGTYLPGSEAEFPTEYNHCYRFYCLGEDNVGNVEEMKTQPDFEYGNYNLMVSVAALPEEGGTVTGEGVYTYGSQVTVTATAALGYEFYRWTHNGVPVSEEPTYTFTILEDMNLVAQFVVASVVTQEYELMQGYNWWSTYIEQEGINGLEMLENSLGDNGVTIRSQTNGYNDYYSGYGWFGSLASISNELSYRVITSAPCSVAMTGHVAIPSQHPITLSHGWTWIGYVPSTAMDINAALDGLEASMGDRMKSQQGYADYYPGYGWYGSLNTIEPGMGLMYYSTNGEPLTFTYPDNCRGEELRQNLTAENNHWLPNVYAYPDNMTVMAVVNLNGEELKSSDYELAAFANGECRGSVKLTYAELLHRHVAFLTVSGKDAAELSFRLYDTVTGMEYYEAEERLTFVADAMVGDATDLYVVHFRDTTGMDEFAESVQVYPNPVSCGKQFSISMNTESRSPIQVEIVNALGVETLRATSSQMPATMTAPTTAGVYTLRISVEGKGTVVHKLVVE